MVALAFAQVSYASDEKKSAAPAAAAPAVPVEFITVTPRSVPIEKEYLGVAQASKKAEVRARIQGFLEKRHYTEGATVKAGDVLFTIDRRQFEADVEIAKARVESAEARKRFSQLEIERLRTLVPQGAATQKDLDGQQADFDSAVADLRLASANLAKAELDLSYTTITAPFDGIVNVAAKEEGSLVDAGSNSLLTTIEMINPVYAVFNISERELIDLRRDFASGALSAPPVDQLPIELILLDGTIFPVTGNINFRNPNVDPRTGTAQFRAEFVNETKGLILLPGQFVKGRMKEITRQNAIAVPQRAIVQNPTGIYVFVIEGGKATLRPVVAGDWKGREWVIESGLKAGDQVVVEGLLRLQPGASVTAKEAAPESAEPAPKVEGN
jgi:membrane fusion protein (multidrug efflux system)